MLESQDENGNSPEPQSIKFTVRTPNGLYLDEGNGTQIHEYMSNSVDLRTYSLSNGSNPTSPPLRSNYRRLGVLLGRWARAFHDDPVRQPLLAKVLGKKNEAQQVKQFVNYQFAVDRVEQFPSILANAKDILENVREMAARELTDSPLQVIHGDFNPSK